MNPASIELLILDVDGVMTDGRITMAVQGEPVKAFYVQDGFAVKLWQRCGGKVALLSGRNESIVERRAAELGVEWVHTGATDKLAGYGAILARAGCGDAVVAYVGDDVPDTFGMHWVDVDPREVLERVRQMVAPVGIPTRAHLDTLPTPGPVFLASEAGSLVRRPP